MRLSANLANGPTVLDTGYYSPWAVITFFKTSMMRDVEFPDLNVTFDAGPGDIVFMRPKLKICTKPYLGQF